MSCIKIFFRELIVASFLLGITSSSGIGAVNAPDAYPSKPIRFVVPFPAGGGTDILTRYIAQDLTESLGKQVIIDNRPGAGTNIGTAMVARAQADGYTILMGSTGMAVNVSLYKDAGFDPKKDFAPITLVGTACNLLVVNPSVPATNVRDLITLAKSRPGKFNYASFGVGTSSHLSGEIFQRLAKVELVHIAYKGSAPALTAVIANETQLMFAGIISGLSPAKSGKLRALAVSSSKRSAAWPELPTIAETLPGFEVVSWYAIFVPAGTPHSVINKLHQASVEILRRPGMRERILAEGTEVVASTPDELGGFLNSQVDRWGKLVRDLKLTPQ